jgi:hypothetical protein
MSGEFGMSNEKEDTVNASAIYGILHDMQRDFGKNQKEMGVLQGKMDSIIASQSNLKKDIHGIETKVESLQVFRNKLLGAAGVVSMIMGFVMSIVVNIVTRKFT